MEEKQPDRAGRWPVHPFLIAAFAILSLIGHNIIEIAPGDGLRALLLSLLLVGIVLLVTRAVARWSWARSGLVASLFAVLFFSYGHIYTFVEGTTLFGFRVGRHLVLGPIWMAIFIAGVWAIKRMKDPANLTRTLNIVGAVLLVVPVYQIGAHELTTINSQENLAKAAQEEPEVGDSSLPDVYYIILDAYTRDDTLLEVFDYDNSPFLQELEARGFRIPRCTQSNFGRTYLSISSSLNMGYVQDFAPYNGPGELTVMMKENAVRMKMEALGYKIVSFDAGFFRTQWPDADLFFSYKDEGGLQGTINEFEQLAMDTTGLLLLLDTNIALGGSPSALVDETIKRERFTVVNYNLDGLEEKVPQIPGPKFVFAHIPAPHGPYVFGEKGEFSTKLDNTPEGYRNQVAYLNQRVIPIIDAILASSDIPPIIVIQGDHGSEETFGDFRRLNILNAYHLPGDGSAGLYPTITPVNTFRLIFDTYFGDHLDLLPDISYFSPPGHDYDFQVATDSRPGCED
jgi:hypothetical protein